MTAEAFGSPQPCWHKVLVAIKIYKKLRFLTNYTYSDIDCQDSQVMENYAFLPDLAEFWDAGEYFDDTDSLCYNV